MLYIWNIWTGIPSRPPVGDEQETAVNSHLSSSFYRSTCVLKMIDCLFAITDVDIANGMLGKLPSTDAGQTLEFEYFW